MADEISFPSTVLKATPDNIPFAFAFAIPLATEGLRLICRDSYDLGKSNFDAPLSSRYEEMDAVVIFDNVLVPCKEYLCMVNQSYATLLLVRQMEVVHDASSCMP